MKNLTQLGWKYLNTYSLNGIFVEKFNELSEEEKGGIVLEMFGDGLNQMFAA